MLRYTQNISLVFYYAFVTKSSVIRNDTVKKVYKFRIAFNLGVKAYNTGYAVYSLFPKYDKITGINTDKLIADHTINHNEITQEDIEQDRLFAEFVKENLK